LAYLNSIPQATDPKNVSQPQILENFSQIYNVFSVDHATFDSPLGAGFHQQVTFPGNLAGAPAANQMRMYATVGASGNIELWLRNGFLGTNNQITTANAVGGANTNGYTMTPAGVLIKWGNITQAGTGAGQPQVFTWSATPNDIAFTTQFFAIAQIGADPALPNKDVNAIAYVTSVANPAQISYNVWRRNQFNTPGTNQNPFSVWFLAVGIP
jgi:hypothetical protein